MYVKRNVNRENKTSIVKNLDTELYKIVKTCEESVIEKFMTKTK